MTEAIPQIVRVDGKERLLVDDSPFLILGLQWGCDSCLSKEEMNPLFPHAAAMGANTAVLPLYWQEVEPLPDQYDFRMIDERIRQAQANHLRIILLWFATWKNACAFYAPDYIRNDPDTYPMALDRHGQRTVSPCPSGETTWQRDRNALVAVMQHLREVDKTHTVIMVQVENEPGILHSDRCYCPRCNERFKREKWESRSGAHAAEAFSAVTIAEYIDRLAVEAKAIYPLPLVDPIGGEWSSAAYWLRDSYIAIGRAVTPIIEAQGTERIFTCVQEPAERETGWAARGCDIMVTYHHKEGNGRGLIIQQGPLDFLLIGVGLSVQFRQPRPVGTPRSIASIEWGRYEGDQWVVLHPMRMERPTVTIFMVEPGVVRVILKPLT
ncbi:MAG TPA: DUF5597 domain-containing protein [Ktedonobacteraceae bacterium]